MVFLGSLRNRPAAMLWSKFAALPVWESRPSALFSLCAATLLGSLLLGGGTHGGFLTDAILELIAIPALLVASASLLALLRTKHAGGRVTVPLILCLVIVLLPLSQLLPLPPWIWTKLPNREELVAIFGLLGHDLPWLPISLVPNATWVSMLSLLPPLAIFLGTVQLDYDERRLMTLILLGMGVIAAFVGLIQVAQGASSPLRFFANTSDVEAVGYFANRNHFATLMYTLLPFAAAWTTDVAFTVGPWRGRKSLETTSIATLTAGFLVLVVLMAADILTRSRAGLALMIVAAFAALALPIADRRRPKDLTPIKLAVATGFLLLLLIGEFGLYRVYEKFSSDPLADARVAFARNTIEAAKAYMPFGSGVGTFVPVYQMFEPPRDLIANVYANHAHDDFLEMWLEGGALSLIILAAFVVWLIRRSAQIWWRIPDNARSLDVLLARAATIAIPLVLAHSFVDYPLRTGGIMAVFALCCALLIEPLTPARNDMKLRARIAEGKGSEYPQQASAAPVSLPATETEFASEWPKVAPDRPEAASQSAEVAPKEAEVRPKQDGALKKPPNQPPQLWGEDIEWPEQWRK